MTFWPFRGGAGRRPPLRLVAALTLTGAGALPLPAPALAQAPREITLEAPTAGAEITSPVEVRGRVTVSPFENNLVGTVFDAAGQAIGRGPVAVTPDDPGSFGGPGSFTGVVAFAGAPGGPGRVEVADVSQKDGSIIASAVVDVVLPGGGPPPAGSTSWLDQPLTGFGWNVPGGAVPAAPSFQGNDDPRCAAGERAAETPEDEQVVAAGWRLFREYQGGWGSRLLFGLSGYDGMCRPLGFQAFVFANGAFAGTLSPDPMTSRAAGALSDVSWSTPRPGAVSALSATYNRYGAQDPLCCPSAMSTAQFEVRAAGIVPGAFVLVPLQVQTAPSRSG